MQILIVKTSSLGDVVQTFPVVGYLRHRFPNATIDWVAEESCAALPSAHPDIRTILKIQTKTWRRMKDLGQFASFRRALRSNNYDVVFDLQGNMKSALFVTSQARAKHKVGFGWRSVHEWPNILSTNLRFEVPEGLNIRDDYLNLVQRFFGDCTPYEDKGVLLRVPESEKNSIQNILLHSHLQGGKCMLVCAGAAWKNKQLDPNTLQVLLEKLQIRHGCRYLFAWGSSEEQALARQMQTHFSKTSVILEKLALPVLQNLMGRVALVFAMDSLPLHLAASAGAPTFSVFGPSLAAKFNPTGVIHGTFQGTCPYNRTFPKRCPILRTCETGACIRRLTADALFAAIDKYIMDIGQWGRPYRDSIS